MVQPLRRVGKDGWLTKTQLQRFPSAAHRFSGLSTLDVTFLAASKDVQTDCSLSRGCEVLACITLCHSYLWVSSSCCSRVS